MKSQSIATDAWRLPWSIARRLDIMFPRGLTIVDLGPTDVYGVRLPLPGDSLPLVLGQVVMRDGEYDEKIRFTV
ncbi:MAG: hypothetical protein R3B91_13665 [Planctomycetaceae bacterium]